MWWQARPTLSENRLWDSLIPRLHGESLGMRLTVRLVSPELKMILVGWTTCKTLPFCFGPILIRSCLHIKDTRLSARYIFAFQESLRTRLSPTWPELKIHRCMRKELCNWPTCTHYLSVCATTYWEMLWCVFQWHHQYDIIYSREHIDTVTVCTFKIDAIVFQTRLQWSSTTNWEISFVKQITFISNFVQCGRLVHYFTVM